MSSALKFPFVFWPQTPPKLSFTCCLIAKNEIRQDENQPYKVITGTEHGLCVMWHFLKVKTLQENNKKLLQPVAFLHGHEKKVTALCECYHDFSPCVASLGVDGTVCLWSLPDGRCVVISPCLCSSLFCPEYLVHIPQPNCEVTNQYSLIAVGSRFSNYIDIIDLKTMKVFNIIESHVQDIRGITFGPIPSPGNAPQNDKDILTQESHKMMVSISRDEALKFWGFHCPSKMAQLSANLIPSANSSYLIKKIKEISTSKHNSTTAANETLKPGFPSALANQTTKYTSMQDVYTPRMEDKINEGEIVNLSHSDDWTYILVVHRKKWCVYYFFEKSGEPPAYSMSIQKQENKVKKYFASIKQKRDQNFIRDSFVHGTFISPQQAGADKGETGQKYYICLLTEKGTCVVFALPPVSSVFRPTIQSYDFIDKTALGGKLAAPSAKYTDRRKSENAPSGQNKPLDRPLSVQDDSKFDELTTKKFPILNEVPLKKDVSSPAPNDPKKAITPNPKQAPSTPIAQKTNSATTPTTKKESEKNDRDDLLPESDTQRTPTVSISNLPKIEIVRKGSKKPSNDKTVSFGGIVTINETPQTKPTINTSSTNASTSSSNDDDEISTPTKTDPNQNFEEEEISTPTKTPMSPFSKGDGGDDDKDYLMGENNEKASLKKTLSFDVNEMLDTSFLKHTKTQWKPACVYVYDTEKKNDSEDDDQDNVPKPSMLYQKKALCHYHVTNDQFFRVDDEGYVKVWTIDWKTNSEGEQTLSFSPVHTMESGFTVSDLWAFNSSTHEPHTKKAKETVSHFVVDNEMVSKMIRGYDDGTIGVFTITPINTQPQNPQIPQQQPKAVETLTFKAHDADVTGILVVNSPKKTEYSTGDGVQAKTASKKKWLITSSADCSVKVWNLQDGSHITTFYMHSGTVHHVFSPPKTITTKLSKHVFCSISNDDRSIILYSLEDLCPLFVFGGHSGCINSIYWRVDLDLMIVKCSDGFVYVWRLTNGFLETRVFGLEATHLIESFEGYKTSSIVCSTSKKALFSFDFDRQILNSFTYPSSSKGDYGIAGHSKGFLELLPLSLSDRGDREYVSRGQTIMLSIRRLLGYMKANKDIMRISWTPAPLLEKDELEISKKMKIPPSFLTTFMYLFQYGNAPIMQQFRTILGINFEKDNTRQMLPFIGIKGAGDTQSLLIPTASFGGYLAPKTGNLSTPQTPNTPKEIPKTGALPTKIQMNDPNAQNPQTPEPELFYDELVKNSVYPFFFSPILSATYLVSVVSIINVILTDIFPPPPTPVESPANSAMSMFLGSNTNKKEDAKAKWINNFRTIATEVSKYLLSTIPKQIEQSFGRTRLQLPSFLWSSQFLKDSSKEVQAASRSVMGSILHRMKTPELTDLAESLGTVLIHCQSASVSMSALSPSNSISPTTIGKLTSAGPSSSSTDVTKRNNLVIALALLAHKAPNAVSQRIRSVVTLGLVDMVNEAGPQYSTAISLLGEGYAIWKYFVPDSQDLLLKLFEYSLPALVNPNSSPSAPGTPGSAPGSAPLASGSISTPTKLGPGISPAGPVSNPFNQSISSATPQKVSMIPKDLAVDALQSFIHIVSYDIKNFIEFFCETLSNPQIHGTDRVLAMITVLYPIIKKCPQVLVHHLVTIVALLLKLVDPHHPNLREKCLVTVTTILRHLVKEFPMITHHQDKQKLAVGNKEGIVVIYDMRTAQKWQVFEAHKSLIIALQFSPDGSCVATYASGDSACKVFNIDQSGVFSLLGVATRALNVFPVKLKIPTVEAEATEKFSLETQIKNCGIEWENNKIFYLRPGKDEKKLKFSID